MNSRFQNIGCCKSYSLYDESGAELEIAESLDRMTIGVTAYSSEDSVTVHLTKGQFEALCSMNSSYDGLEVHERLTAIQPEASAEEDEPEDYAIADVGGTAS